MIFLIICLNCYSQKNIKIRPYDCALNATESMINDSKKLSNYLTKPFQTDSDKVNSIIYWITLNIAYDVKSINDSTLDLSAQNVLKNKASVCEGYANLFYDLCANSNLDCKVVIGYAKGFDYTKGKIQKTNHAWNVVMIDKKWKLVDLTWAAGYVTDYNDTLKFVRKFNKRYVFDSPKDFILEHFPEDKKMQLINPPITEQKFYSLDFEVARLNKKFNNE